MINIDSLPLIPAQPPESSWGFIEELRQPRHRKMMWRRSEPGPGGLSLAGGVHIVAGFNDPERVLDTAYDDLRAFFTAGAVPLHGEYRIETGWTATEMREAYRVEITPGVCRILAADTEGIRRGIYFLEDEIARSAGPFLRPGVFERRPAVKLRISRCFFGPIKRPPKLRDELMDDVDYYPDHYLARLAYEGINGLWLTVEFKDICRTDLAPEYGQDRERRLDKLRRTIRQCGRYGIKVYLFAIEPVAWSVDSSILRRYPEMGGIHAEHKVLFCPFSDTARRFLHDCLHSIFSSAPELGGLINISLGESYTTCASHGSDCRRLCTRGQCESPADILHATLAAMRAGMNAAAPAAELICWLYVPGNSTGAGQTSFDWIADIAGNMPAGVILQYNFESNGSKEQLGKPRHAADYWLSYSGPSPVFRACAQRATGTGGRVSAKLQVGCSHETATVPYVPAPSALYHKYAAMRELGVDAVMMCWYFGNYPGIMNKAAGELAFDPFPASEHDFLLDLARINWGDRAEDAVRGYELLWRGYEHYPVNCMMQYYGPMHDGPVWPLFLEPVDAPLAPTWLLKIPYSGDRIGEAINYAHTLDEVIELCRCMSENWNRGAAIFRNLARDTAVNGGGGMAAEGSGALPVAPCAREVGVVEALGIHFQSAYNIFRFYDLREKLFRGDTPAPLNTLATMAAIVNMELELDAQLVELTAADSTLGFHPEAEGYKYFPEKIRWRMRQLQQLLAEDFPAMEETIRAGADPFPAYTGKQPAGEHVACPQLKSAPEKPEAWRDIPWQSNRYLGGRHLGVLEASIENHAEWRAAWRTAYDADGLCFQALCPGTGAESLYQEMFPNVPADRSGAVETLEIAIEPRRLWPVESFLIGRDGPVTYRAVSGRRNPGGWRIMRDMQNMQVVDDSVSGRWGFMLYLPWRFFEGMATPERPIRINVMYRHEYVDAAVNIYSSWVKPVQAAIRRLAYHSVTPAELGWITF